MIRNVVLFLCFFFLLSPVQYLCSALPPECRAWDYVNVPKPGDFAIVSSAFYIDSLDETDPGSNYEFWGFVEAKHGNWIMGKTYFGTPNDHKVCEISQLGGPKNYAVTVLGAAASVGLAVATGGSSVLVQASAGAAGGFALMFAEDQLSGKGTCEGGLIGSVLYPVTYRTDTRQYSFNAELIEDDTWSSDEHYYINTKNGDWSKLDDCWGTQFENKLVPGKQCEQKVDICSTRDCKRRVCIRPWSCRYVSSVVGKATIKTVVIVWVRGPLQDGEVQKLQDGNAVVERKSFFGPKSGTCLR